MSEPSASARLHERLELWASRLVALQQGRRTGSLRRAEAVELELLLRDAAEAALTAERAARAQAPPQERRLQDELDDLREAYYRTYSEPALAQHFRLFSQIAKWLTEQGKDSYAAGLAAAEEAMQIMWRELERLRAATPDRPAGTATKENSDV